jgi:hypothetical protein
LTLSPDCSLLFVVFSSETVKRSSQTGLYYIAGLHTQL